MRLVKADTGRPFIVFCKHCDTKLYAGEVEVDPRKPDFQKYPVYADLDGEAFKAYYCAEFAENAS